jgi:hypothetical protein
MSFQLPTTTTAPTKVDNHIKVQTLVFIRHGIAAHNITQNYSDPNMIDAPLVMEGKVRSIQTGIDVKNWFRTRKQQQKQPNNSNNTSKGSKSNIDLFVTSPLTRCIQTMTIAFLPGDDYTDDDDDDYATVNTDSVITTPQQKQLKSLIPIICHEDVREAFGTNYPDKRRSKSILKVRIVVCLLDFFLINPSLCILT